MKEELNFSNKLKISKDKSTTRVTLCGVKFENPEKWNILRRSDDSILNTKPRQESLDSDLGVYQSRKPVSSEY